MTDTDRTPTAEDRPEQCWFNRFHQSEPQCRNVGTWRKQTALSAFNRACRWCFLHKHDDDIEIAQSAAIRADTEEKRE